jgi:hypothetical protein
MAGGARSWTTHRGGGGWRTGAAGCGFLAGIAALAVLLAAVPAHAYTVRLTAAELQAAVRPYFPQAQTGVLGTVTVSHPRVILRAGSDRIGLGCQVAGELLGGLTAQGEAVVEGEVAYDPERGEFHLREPVVTQLEVDGLPDPFTGFVADAVSAVALRQVPVIVLFRVPREDLAGAATLRVLKSARVRNGALELELGP